MRKPYSSLAAAGALMLGACAIPGKEVGDELVPAPAPAEEEPVTVPTPAPEEPIIVDGPPAPAIADHGLRLPPMLDLPGEGEFRATSPGARRPAETGPVISRPPTDPPPRPKPQEAPEEPAD